MASLLPPSRPVDLWIFDSCRIAWYPFLLLWGHFLKLFSCLLLLVNAIASCNVRKCLFRIAGVYSDFYINVVTVLLIAAQVVKVYKHFKFCQLAYMFYYPINCAQPKHYNSLYDTIPGYSQIYIYRCRNDFKATLLTHFLYPHNYKQFQGKPIITNYRENTIYL